MKTGEIISFDDPRIAPYRGLRRANLIDSLGHGYFIAETFKVVSLLLDSDIPLISVLGTKEWIERLPEHQLFSRVGRENILLTTQKNMESIVGFSLHQGVMAIGERPEDTAVAQLGSKVLVLNGVVNPENVGSIVRASVALGQKSILVDHESADPYLRRAVRVSMGNVFETKVHRTPILIEELKKLKSQGLRIIGTDLRSPTHRLPDYRFPEKYALVVGSEFEGLNEEVKNCCDDILEIPAVRPLNASHAAAVVLYAASINP